MQLKFLFFLTSLLFSLSLSTLQKSGFKCDFMKSDSSENQAIYTIYDVDNGILHLLSLVGDPTFLIYRTSIGASSLNVTWESSKGIGIQNVNITDFELLYGFVARSIIEFNVTSSGIDFNLKDFYTSNSSSFKLTPLSQLQFNLTEQTDCNETGRIHVSLKQKHITSNETQFNLSFDLKAFSKQGRLTDQPRYSYRGNNSIIDFTISNFPYNITNATAPASRLAIELDFIRYQRGQLVFSSKSDIDDEYTPAVFTQNTVNVKLQHNYFYWKPIAYVSKFKTVENSMMVTFLNGTLGNVTVQQNTTGFYHSLQKNMDVVLERDFFLFGTDGDSTLNADYVVFRAELGIGIPPTDSISLPLMVAIGVGFGLPVLGLCLGFIGMFCFMIYKCCFRKSTRNARYVSIN